MLRRPRHQGQGILPDQHPRRHRIRAACTLTGTHEFGSSSSCGDHKFKRRSELSPYLHDDRLTIECAITIIADNGAKSPLPNAVPPSDIVQHLAKLLQQKENTDVTFMVGGQAFPAHKTVLAMRSPVFKDDLYGTTTGGKDTDPIIAIDDMQPVVFEALLHFIYTDSLPAPMDNIGGQTIRHLLVAADRYAMERMKAVCEGILCEDIDVNTVATTLAFADQHRCGMLIDACVQFIASLGKMQIYDLMARIQGYAELNAERWEKACRLGRSQSSLHIGSLIP
jgi:speckle-type POZ protein